MRISLKARCTCIVGLCLLPVMAFSGEPRPTLQVKGQIVYEAFLPNGTERHWTRDFTATVKDCGWLIESAEVSNGQYEMKARVDGLIYNVSAVNRERKPDLNNYAVLVEDDDVPMSDVSGISAIWLAYASACYLQTASNQFKPIWMLDDVKLRQEGFRLNGVVKTLDSHLPKELVYLNSGPLYAEANGNRIVLRAPPSAQIPVTNAIYRVLETTNSGTMELPRVFEFQRFGVRPDFTTYPVSKITGRVASARLGATLRDAAPELQGPFYVQDMRFQKTDTNLKVMSDPVPGRMFMHWHDLIAQMSTRRPAPVDAADRGE